MIRPGFSSWNSWNLRTGATASRRGRTWLSGIVHAFAGDDGVGEIARRRQRNAWRGFAEHAVFVMGSALATGCSPALSPAATGSAAGDLRSAPRDAPRAEQDSPRDGGTGTAASRDAECACSYLGSEPHGLPLRGVLSLPCYCARSWSPFGNAPPACLDFERSFDCRQDAARRAAVVTYSNCGFVTISYGAGNVDERHFDARTHALVGARRAAEHSITCDGSLVFSIQAGVLPADDCEIAKVEYPCFGRPAVEDASFDEARR
jgi:hypothetical protein